jgi:hypothetical protein
MRLSSLLSFLVYSTSQGPMITLLGLFLFFVFLLTSQFWNLSLHVLYDELLNVSPLKGSLLNIPLYMPYSMIFSYHVCLAAHNKQTNILKTIPPNKQYKTWDRWDLK